MERYRMHDSIAQGLKNNDKIQHIIKTISLCGVTLFQTSYFFSTSNLSKKNKIAMDAKTITNDTTRGQRTSHVYFVDKFSVPKNSGQDFKKQMKYNMNFLKNLAGFIDSYAMEQTDADGNLKIITVAIWQNAEYVKNARNSMEAEYKRTNFDRAAFYDRLELKSERGVYTDVGD